MRARTFAFVVAGLAVAGSAIAAGIPGDVPFVLVDPRVDGADSVAVPGEWDDALIASDEFVDPTTGVSPAGFFYYENKTDWLATSSAGSSATYSGPTLFVAHDIFGDTTGLFASFRTNDPGDWNYVKATLSNGNVVECWNFGGFSTATAPPHVPPVDVNAPDDGRWLPDASGLGSSGLIPEGAGPDLIDDRGFIVRLNGVPASDVHWLPGDPEPGDPLWSWDTYYGCFARAGFNKTFQDNGTDPDALHAFNHEVYEWCFHATPVGVPEPLQCLEWRIEWVDPPKRWIIFVAPDWRIHFGPPPVPALPWPFALAGVLAFAAAGAFVFRRRRARASATVVVALFAAGLCGCGGSNGGNNQNKFPPPFQLQRPLLREGWLTQPYADSLQATGANPPFTFVLTGGTFPPGLTLNTNGTITGIPTQVGNFSFDFSVTNAIAQSLSSGSAIHIGDAALGIPIEIVSLSLQSVNPILVCPAGVETIGSIRTKGGDYFSPMNFALASAPPPGAFILSQGGVIRWTPPIAQPQGPVTLQVQVNNGLLNPVLNVQLAVP